MLEVFADELEKEVIFMQQELIVKRMLLDECRQKLNTEISDHAETKSIANKYSNEIKELQIQLEISLTATQKLEEENNKTRELLVKLQVQVDAYLNEREQILNKYYLTEVENNALKNEIIKLNEQLKGHIAFQEYYKTRQTKTESLVNEIISKQEILNKEQIRLEATCKEGLRFAEKLSEEAKFQAKFIQESRIGQTKLENEMIRLMAAVKEMDVEKEKNTGRRDTQEGGSSYFDEWKAFQRNMKTRYEELQQENKRLVEELNFATDQIEMLIKNC